MSEFLELLNQQVVLPQWHLIAVVVASVLVSFASYMTAARLSRKRALLKATRQERGLNLSAPQSPSERMPTPVVSQPFKQHYWYYVTGVSGRFPTLREALSASGVEVSADKPLDWKKLSSDTHDRIKRVKIGDKQPVAEPAVSSRADVQPRPGREETEIKKEAESVVRKPLGNGAFVTFKKKSR